MPESLTQSRRDPVGRAPIPLGGAAAAWAAAWVVGSVLAVGLIGAVGSDAENPSVPALALGAVVGWAVFLAAIGVVSKMFGSGNPIVDLAVSVRPFDMAGGPLGIIAQLLLVPAVYVPLRWFWPATFSDDALAEVADDLVDGVAGWQAVVLIVVVVIGAPIVEELVYRGLLQRSMARAVSPAVAWVATSLWFGAIHLQPVLLPGLFIAGMCFGLGVVLTGRVGFGLLTHAAFNATGLLIAFGVAG